MGAEPDTSSLTHEKWGGIQRTVTPNPPWDLPPVPRNARTSWLEERFPFARHETGRKKQPLVFSADPQAGLKSPVTSK